MTVELSSDNSREKAASALGAAAEVGVVCEPVRLLVPDQLVMTAWSTTINSEVVSSGSGADCLGSPLNAARWLVDVMSQQGTPLKAGDVLMTCALGPTQPSAKGDNLVVDLDELGTVSLSMSGDV